MTTTGPDATAPSEANGGATVPAPDTAPGPPAPADQPTAKPRSSRSVGDMFRSLTVVGAIVVVILVFNYRAPEDPVKQVDPYPTAAMVATVSEFPVLVPTDPGWRATAARWEPTRESDPVDVWYAGGAYTAEGPFASVSQSTAASPDYIAEQTGAGSPDGTLVGIGSQQWARYSSASGRSLVLISAQGTTIVTGTGTWEQLERFAGSLEAVDAAGATG